MKAIFTKFKIGIVIFLNFLFICSANSKGDAEQVQMEDPVQFLHKITDQVLTKLRSSGTDDPHIDTIIKIVDTYIMPNVDFNEMGVRIASRGIWDKASKTDQSAFIKELKNLLIKTYAVTLKSYTEEKIEFQNYSLKPGVKRIQIRSTVMRPNKENLSVDYRLIAFNNSWKVYDLIIEGVSILNGFVAQFSDDIKMHGLRFVTYKIKEHNKTNEAN